MAETDSFSEEDIERQYTVKSDGVPARVTIGEPDDEYVLLYLLERPKIDEATEALLNDIRKELIQEVSLTTEEFVDSKALDEVKEKFRRTASEMLEERLAETEEQTRDILIGNLIHDMLGLGDIELLLSDSNLEEIVVNGSDECAWVYHKELGWLKTNVFFEDEDEIYNYSSEIGRQVGKEINSLHPLLDAHLPSGDRVNSTLYPISTQGNTITIRKFARDPWTITDFIQNGTMDPEAAAFIWLCMQYELNVIVSGGTGAGKTSLLNVLMPFIPPNQRVLSIEDTREISLPSFLHWVPTTTREPNPEGKGGVSMLDLLVNALRMRPDRILVGEIREEKQAEVLFEAMHTGHSVYSTLHADDAEQTVRRLVNPPIDVPKTMVTSVDLNVVMFRDRRRNYRRVMEVAEVVENQSGEAEENVVYKWDSDTDETNKISKAGRVYEKLRTFTGMDAEEIDQNIQEKQDILEWMVENGVDSVDGVGKTVAEYYQRPADIVEAVRSGANPEDINY
nr:MAG: Flp pilus assembly protein, ATPase CpaF [Candidatus Nanosalinarum sp. J07AB56]